MLLEPRCTGSITSSRHPLGLEMFFKLFLTKTKQDQAHPSHVQGKFGPTALNFFYNFFVMVTFLGHPVQFQCPKRKIKSKQKLRDDFVRPKTISLN